MTLSVTFRQMEASDALRDYVSEKLEHIVQKYLRSEVDASVTMSMEKYWHIATITFQIRGQRIKSQERSEDMYSSVDLALGKLERQLRRYKDKIRDRKSGPAAPSPTPVEPSQTFSHRVIAEPEDLGIDFDESDYESISPDLPDPEEFGYIPVTIEGKQGSQPQHVKVLRSEYFSAQPMSMSEAIMQLNLQDRQFLVFTHSENSKINILYRRIDGNYGIIET